MIKNEKRISKSGSEYQVSKHRLEYTETVNSFKESNEPLVITPRLSGSDLVGWIMTRGGVILPNARGDKRAPRKLETVVAIAKSYGINSFEVSLDGFDVRGI